MSDKEAIVTAPGRVGRVVRGKGGSIQYQRAGYTTPANPVAKRSIALPPQRPKPVLKSVVAKPKDWTLDWAGVKEETHFSLTFSPTAWAKIQYFRDNENEVEVCGFGISHEENLLTVIDFELIDQSSQSAYTEMNDDAIADHVDDHLEAGIEPKRCSRIWIHTHPGMSPRPSSHDETTFSKTFRDFDWSVMCIISNGEASYARLKITTPLSIITEIPVKVDYSIPVDPIDYELLEKLYKEKVSAYSYVSHNRAPGWNQYQGGSYNIGSYYGEWEGFASDAEEAEGGNRSILPYSGISVSPRRRASRNWNPLDEEDEVTEASSVEGDETCIWCRQEWISSALNDKGICPECVDIMKACATSVETSSVEDAEEEIASLRTQEETPQEEVEDKESQKTYPVIDLTIDGDEETTGAIDLTDEDEEQAAEEENSRELVVDLTEMEEEK